MIPAKLVSEPFAPPAPPAPTITEYGPDDKFVEPKTIPPPPPPPPNEEPPPPPPPTKKYSTEAEPVTEKIPLALNV
jgi:hypothetical protein